MDDSSQFVPVIPDIKDHNMVPPMPVGMAPPAQDAATGPAPVTTTSWWDWDSWPLPMKLAMGALLVSLICLVIYAAYVWFTKKRDAEKKEAEKKNDSGQPPGEKPSATETKQDMAAIMQTQALLKKRREEELRRANKPPVVIFTQEASEDVDDSEAPRVEILDDGEEPEEEPPKKKLVPSPTAPERPKIPEPTTPLPRAAPKSPAPQAPTKPAPQGGRNELAIGGRSIILKQPLADESESEDEGESEESGVRVEKDDIDDFLS